MIIVQLKLPHYLKLSLWAGKPEGKAEFSLQHSQIWHPITSQLLLLFIVTCLFQTQP